MKQEFKAAGGAIERAVHELVLANDGAWTWFNDPRALFHNGRLYFGYVKRGTTRPALSVYDPETGQHFALAERKIRPLHRLSHQGHRALCGIILETSDRFAMKDMKSVKFNALSKDGAVDPVHPMGAGKSEWPPLHSEGLSFMLFMVNSGLSTGMNPFQ